MKQWVERLSLVAVSMIVALLISEGIVRIVGLKGTFLTRGALHSNDPDAGWICYPNLDARFCLPGSFNVGVVCNSRGLRDSEKDFAKPPGTRRIVVLGDSSMWGYGVENEEMFSTILQELIPGTETVNLGVNGYSTVQELVRFETEGLRYEPDLTVLAFCWNDLEDNFDDKEGRRPVAVVEGNNVLRIENRPVRRPWKSPIKQWFQHHSRLFGFGEYCTGLLKHKLKERRRANALTAKPPASDVALPAKNDKMGVMEFSLVDIYAPPSPEMALAWKAVRLLLSRIKELATKDGGRLVVVYVTEISVAGREVFAKEIRIPGLGPESAALDWDRPSNHLGEVCAALDIPYVDLTPAFRRHPNPSSLFLIGNPHWSAAGHRLTAETVAAKIKDLQR